MTRAPRTIALIVAAGSGQRAGSGLPKQYRSLCGKSALRRSIEAFARNPNITGVHVVFDRTHEQLYRACVDGLDLPPPINGGATRQESVRLGLESINPLEPAAVLIHDAARPFVSQKIINDTISALATHDGAIPTLPSTDTIKYVTGPTIGRTVPREGLVFAQTPQTFRFLPIFHAHLSAKDVGYTDDAAIAEAAGLKVKAVGGDHLNFKLTTPEDFILAEALLNNHMPSRTANGFDVHRFGPGDHIWLCGIKIPHSHGLEGHSDADVGLHALTDALLGTIGEADIGQHFPPSDSKWRGAPSKIFVEHAAMLIRKVGGTIDHVDLTLICESPKVSPHREEMRRNIANLLAIDLSRVSIKATTTEGLGFTGRKEGIAAQALATVRAP